MTKTNLNLEQTDFLQSLGLNPNSPNLKTEIEALIYIKKVSLISKSQLSEVMTKIYTQIIPKLQAQNKTWDIDYSFERSEKKRRESLKKRGCGEIIEV